MAAPMEVALVSDAAGPLCNCSVWELHSGSALPGYRGGNSGPRGLALLGGEHLLGAQLGKSYINVWELQRKDQLQQKIICPGPVTCLTASPNGLYILAGVAESIYLWEVSNGNLLAILNRHYQDLTCLCFTDDSSHFLSGAKDCLALVWNLYSVLQAEPSQIPDPRHVWSRHSLPITDLCCGFGGPLARAATASLDQTAKLWEISSGELLLSVLFDVGIMAVTLDLSEYHMFCGGMDGSIFQVDLCAWPVQRDRTFQTERENGKVFKGHRNQVTCLSVSTDGSLLLSGSHDETVRLWDIQSKQCLKTMNHKVSRWWGWQLPKPSQKVTVVKVRPRSSVTLPLAKLLPRGGRWGPGCLQTLFFCCQGPFLDGRCSRSPLALLHWHQRGDSRQNLSCDSGESYLEKAEKMYAQMYSTREKNLVGDQEHLTIQVSELEEEVSTLRKINKNLFDFSARIITKPAK
ncbi:wd repeat-containing protein 18 [Limosa lapponica baueri]|uniref:WD repeat-containing protein 18 n=1 Tax=Limosa lapponica baueri TaxID=1758121 RepID=A0A2I0TKD5_LIMLA|nr:wd repeat-containing protein 18 [Limosa lapponica baueri]